MSALVAIHLAQGQADRVSHVVVLTPPPPAGFGADDAALATSRGLALADDATRLAALSARFGRLSPGWTSFKASRWRATADPAAAAAYVGMFARDGVPDPTARVAAPVLAITGEQDAPYMRKDAVAGHLGPLCDRLEVAALADSGHYPMQEVPPLTVALVEKFLGR